MFLNISKYVSEIRYDPLAIFEATRFLKFAVLYMKSITIMLSKQLYLTTHPLEDTISYY